MLKKNRILWIAFIVLLVTTTVIYNLTPRSPSFAIEKIIYQDESLEISHVASIPDMVASHITHGTLFATEDHFLYQENKYFDGVSFKQLGHFDKNNPNIIERVQDVVARLRIIRNLRHDYGVESVVVLKSGTIIVFYDCIYRSTDGGKSFQMVFDYKSINVHQPLFSGVAVDKDDNIYFGEYTCQPRPHTVKIMKGATDGTAWNLLYEFPSGQIWHIHSVKYDTFRDALYVCTGDRDEESRLISLARDGTVFSIGGGDQGWRIVSLLVTRDALLWCSDDDRDGAKVYRYDFKTGKRKEIQFIGKISDHSTQLKDGTLVFSTTYEPESEYSKRFNPDNSTDIWLSRDGEKWIKAISFPGRVYKTPYGLTRPTIKLPSGDSSSNYLFLTPKYTSDSDYSLQVYNVRWKSNYALQSSR